MLLDGLLAGFALKFRRQPSYNQPGKGEW